MNQAGTGTLWLHVGTHKTGTTSIQRALKLSAARLRAAGVAVFPEVNAWTLANTFLRPEIRSTPRMSYGDPLPDLARLAAVPAKIAAARGTAPEMVISSEEFCLLRTPLEAFALKSALAPTFARIVPLITLRNPDDWRAARADQLRKTGCWEAQKALPDDQSTDGAWYYDSAAILAFWQGIGTPVVLDYDRICAEEGDILPAFARAIGQPGLFDGLDLRINTRVRG